jgi:hypothetical protein
MYRIFESLDATYGSSMSDQVDLNWQRRPARWSLLAMLKAQRLSAIGIRPQIVFLSHEMSLGTRTTSLRTYLQRLYYRVCDPRGRVNLEYRRISSRNPKHQLYLSRRSLSLQPYSKNIKTHRRMTFPNYLNAPYVRREPKTSTIVYSIIQMQDLNAEEEQDLRNLLLRNRLRQNRLRSIQSVRI